MPRSLCGAFVVLDSAGLEFGQGNEPAAGSLGSKAERGPLLLGFATPDSVFTSRPARIATGEDDRAVLADRLGSGLSLDAAFRTLSGRGEESTTSIRADGELSPHITAVQDIDHGNASFRSRGGPDRGMTGEKRPTRSSDGQSSYSCAPGTPESAEGKTQRVERRSAPLFVAPSPTLGGGLPIRSAGEEDRIDDVDRGVRRGHVLADRGGASVDAECVTLGGDRELITVDGGDRSHFDEIGR